MKTVDLQDLLRDGYQEDRESLRKFERRYAPITIPGVLGFAIGIYLTFNYAPTAGMVVIGISFAVLLGACIHAYFAIPVSVTSGLPMEKYRRIGGLPNETEFIYVDHNSRTFCRRVPVTTGN